MAGCGSGGMVLGTRRSGTGRWGLGVEQPDHAERRHHVAEADVGAAVILGAFVGPFDDVAERLGVNRRLNEIGGISIADDMAARAAAALVRLDALRPPADRAAFFAIFDDVAARLDRGLSD